MTGAHGIHPAGHEHVRCRYCGRLDVHTARHPTTGLLVYAPHNTPGGGGEQTACLTSNRQPIHNTDRHQPNPTEHP